MQEIYIEDTGTGYPLVLVHGYLGSSEMWNLQKEYKKVSFIRPFYGRYDCTRNG